MKDRIRIAMIGCGRFAKNFVPLFKAHPEVEKVYEYCHIPVDSYMLSITNYTMSQAWSKLNDYSEYLEYQNWFRNNYPDDIPLDKEFYLWLEAEKNNTNRTNRLFISIFLKGRTLCLL